jgi:translation initiation factor 4B
LQAFWDRTVPEFLIVAGGDWADEIDLPTAPAAAFDRQAQTVAPLGQYSNNTSTASFDASAVPNEPPYVAYVGNLSFNVTEHDLETFFGDAQVKPLYLIQVKSVRLIMDLDTQRPKGYGYVDFVDRESLLSARNLEY